MNSPRGSLVIDGAVRARANVNIALIKYWGKAPAHGPDDANLPAVPSLSLTLDGLFTDTTVRFDTDLQSDRVVLDGEALSGGALARARVVLDAVRRRADVAAPFSVVSTNHVPTAAGLASSASGMAALAGAAMRCAGLDVSPAAVSEIARIGSGSASRSVYEGWVSWQGRRAEPVAPADHWDVAVVVVVIGDGPKSIGSREAMNRTATNSPYYAPWVTHSPDLFREGVDALRRRDFKALCHAMERSTMWMHACALAADPPILYWKPETLAVLEALAAIKAAGTPCGYTMDAGPNVKVFCPGPSADTLRAQLAAIPGVKRVVIARPGAGLKLEVLKDEVES